MTPLTSAMSRALIHFVWEGSIIGIALWVVLIALKKRSAHARYIAACSALIALAVLPVATTLLLYARTASNVPAPTMSGIAQWISSNDETAVRSQALWLAWFEAWALPVWSLGVV